MNVFEEFQKIQKLVENKKLKLRRQAAYAVIQNYNFIHISENISFEEKKKEIYENISKSRVIVIDQSQKFNQLVNQKYYFISYEKTIILLNESSHLFLEKLLSSNSNWQIFFLTNKSDDFKKEIRNLNQIFYFSEGPKEIVQIWSFIVPCISSYLIKKSYSQLNNHRISNFIKNIEKPLKTIVIKEEDYVILRNIGTGNSFTCELIYHIIHEKLYVIKMPNIESDEFPKLIEREKKNYMFFNHPLLPTFYGTVENKNCIVIEFINGRILNNINQMQLTVDEIFYIIYEICIIFKYFHSNDLIYRDLKGNNIIIDEHKMAVLIDFDRLIEYDPSCEHTSDLMNAPINPSFKDDIRCLGKTIKYILQETKNSFDVAKQRDKLLIYSKVEQIIKLCLNSNEDTNHSISNIIKEFDSIFEFKIKISDGYDKYITNCKILDTLSEKSKKNRNDPVMYYNLGVIYHSGEYTPVDIEKAIHYFSLAANQNIAEALFNLGIIYHTGKYIPMDIHKAIHYFTLAANQNFMKAQFNLGVIYGIGDHVLIDIGKSIHYLTLAAKQNYADAQFNLGVIYNKGKFGSIDINKSIYYFTLAANQNHTEAQYNLGVIYFKGEHVPINITKAIDYFTLAANQNHANAQFALGIIYHEGKHVPINSDKAIHYLTFAANQKHANAQFALSLIYGGFFSIKNMKKSTLYIVLSSKNGNREANFSHGYLLHEGKYLKRNIREAVHYYKEASSFNNQFAKNNLGILYKHGFEKDVPNRISQSIEYFEEAIKQKNDFLSMYNLSHIYFYDETVKQNFNPIDLLIKSLNLFFLFDTTILLSLVLVHKFDSDFEQITTELENRVDVSNVFFSMIIDSIIKLNLLNQEHFDWFYEYYREKDYLYNIERKPILVSELEKYFKEQKIPKYPNMKEISEEFYEGFGRDLLSSTIYSSIKV